MIKTYILIALCVFFWSGNFIVGRYINEDIEPIELAFFRWLFVSLMLSPYFIIYRQRILEKIKNNFLIITLLALLSVTSFNTILYIGLQDTGATNALLINLSVPIMILLFSFVILKQDIKLNQIVGIGVSSLGVLFLLSNGKVINLLNLQFHQGDLWILTASASWALYSVLLKFRPKVFNDIEYFISIVFIGFLFLLLLYLIQGYEVQRELKIVSSYWWIFLYVSLFASILSYYFWHYGIDKIGANKTAQATYLMPVFGSILAYIFLGEVLELYHLIGTLFIGLGIYFSLFFHKKRV